MKTFSFHAVALLATIASLFDYTNSASAATIDVTVAPNGKNGSPLRIVDQNGRPAVSGVPSATSTTVDVTVAPGANFTFDPSTVNISVGDTVRWTWAASGHSVTSGAGCTPDGQFCSPNNMNCSAGTLNNAGFVYTFTFAQAGSFSYFCIVHCNLGMTGSVNVSAASPTPTPTTTPSASPSPTPTPTPSTPTPTPTPDGCYSNFTTAEGCDAFGSLTIGAGNTGLGWRSLFL